MILLHEEELRHFLDTWRRARAAGVHLPETSDPDYASYECLLVHVLGCARGYMLWMCEKLGLPQPDIRPTPAPDAIEVAAAEQLELVCAGWRAPLREVPRERFSEVYESRWSVPYCIDAMLEHAVMHPIRHTHQLETLMESGDRHET